MSYEKIGFEKGQILKSEHLNHIEEGIVNTLADANAYTDSQRLGYEETVVNKLWEYTVPAGQGGSTALTINEYGATWLGRDESTYLVTVNGKTYEVECWVIKSADDDYYCLGNEDLTVEPHFCIKNQWGYHRWIIQVYDPNGATDTIDRHLSIGIEETTTHTIEPKFLPGVCLPVVDFTGMSSGELTDETTIQLLNELADSKTPFILKYSYMDRMYMSSFMDYYGGTDGYVNFDSTYNSPAAYIRKENGVWTFTIDTGA